METHVLIWILPVLPQKELETCFLWLNGHLTEAGLVPLAQFSEIKTRFLNEPKDALRIEIPIRTPNAPRITPNGGAINIDAIQELRVALWSEVFAGTHAGPKPFAISLIHTAVAKATKRLFCFDMDSTLINEEVIDEVARSANLYDEIASLTESAMQGQTDFKTSFRNRVKLLKGIHKGAIEAMIPTLSLSPGAEAFLGMLRFKGAKTAILSGGFEFVLKHFQRQLYIDQIYGNVLEFDEEERITGEVKDPIVDAEYKQRLVDRLKMNYQTLAEETVVVGDGANDILMMQEAGLSVSFCGKPKLSAQTNTVIFDRNLLWLKALI